MAREFGSGTWRYVNLTIASTTLKYIFNSKLKEGLKNDFGQTDVTATFNVTNAVLSPNRPKPPRASIRAVDGYESSFCSSDKVKSLSEAGYQITRPQLAIYNQTTLSRVLVVTLNGVNYAWRRPRNAGGEVDVAPLGASDASGQVDLVFGADFPKPAQAYRNIPQQGTYRCFVDNSKISKAALDPAAVEAGWNLSKPQDISLESLKAILKI